MQTLLDRAVSGFMRETYGADRWQAIVDRMAIGEIAPGPEGSYFAHAMREAALSIAKPEDDLFEDLGAWLARLEPIRRLLRFSGSDFRDFVTRLDELPGRAHLVVPELQMPSMSIRQDDRCTVRIALLDAARGWDAIIGGILRGMADDYGALGLIVVERNLITVHISDESFSQDRGFRLDAAYQSARSAN